MKTTVADIESELWAEKTPKACRNFVQLCTGESGKIYGEPFKNEFHTRLRFCRRDLIAMANAAKDDSGSTVLLYSWFYIRIVEVIYKGHRATDGSFAGWISEGRLRSLDQALPEDHQGALATFPRVKGGQPGFITSKISKRGSEVWMEVALEWGGGKVEVDSGHRLDLRTN
ncbi:Peptidyl-prolyl cis-trans isomerase CWC27 like protein [Eufriesea mexicana]|uniref:Peptidyl-prolyl cis-trans isomerase CWC27 like protein n=1 Tax=Eufriesea mexicana TaxID=516756 RepID=A0A310SB48_9HYME|nr:Peptidyl-prolyl cis-trans isomerase CWC27 like protein [Eufriesea mexicana]